MKKLCKFMLVLILSVSIIGCSTKDESVEVKDQVNHFFTELKKGNTDKVQKLCSTSANKQLGLTTLDKQFESLTDQDTYGKTFIKEAKLFRKDILNSLFQNIKIGKVTVKENKATVVVSGKAKNYNNVNFNQDEINSIVEKYINEHASEFQGMTDEKEITEKVFDDVSKDCFDSLKKQLKDVETTSFKSKITLKKTKDQWKIIGLDN